MTPLERVRAALKRGSINDEGASWVWNSDIEALLRAVDAASDYMEVPHYSIRLRKKLTTALQALTTPEAGT